MTSLFILLQALGCQADADVICLEPETRVEPDLSVCKQAALYEATASIGTGEGELASNEDASIHAA